ncbi:beta-galactosidase [Paenibacillus xylanexedens]|uniref:beta-galactosidase n=1 Tax=Paenibacillus xylanexedens TaxID=528191 RepID=UPI000F547577|nr:beta-galactosidase [Paenibacillus xylanexedens]RPK30709.1 Beta-galactosidase [Paenibacillus xylanexedens]
MNDSIAGSQIRFILDAKDKEIRAGRMTGSSGKNPRGESYDFTNYYMLRNDKPHIPVVGEFHFSRFAYLQWEEELLKMKAGGVNIVASYVFWNFHEEQEGEFNWSGNLNLRHFVDLCGKHELPLIVRIGPFCHGEVRNGGMPDWLFSYPFEVRSNDEGYLHYAKRLYREIARQLNGCFYQEGGPIIGVQLENEYMHAGAPMDAWGYTREKYISSGRDGREHLKMLRHIAEEVGMKPMFYTATAWGNAAVPEEGTLPMLAGYAYTPWIPNQPPSREYLFQDLHMNPVEEVDYDSLEYPAAYCELAGGMQVSYHARPVVDADSVEAMTIVKLANGSNLIGYYMYHGGTNPVGQKTYMNEQALPKMTYDYQAPLGEFGRIGESYDRIRTLSMFLEAYGELLAPMGSVIPEEQHSITPENMMDLRWSVRQQEGSGFLFMNNYQDHVALPDRDIQLELHTGKGTAFYPREGTMQLKSRMAAILPFHMNLNGMKIISATVQPLTRFMVNQELTAVFYAHEGMAPEYVIDATSVTNVDMSEGPVSEQGNEVIIHPMAGMVHHLGITTSDGTVIRIITLTREEALHAYRFHVGGEERLVISSSHLYVQNEMLICNSLEQTEFEVSFYPAPVHVSPSKYAVSSQSKRGIFDTYTFQVSPYEPAVEVDYPKEYAATLRLDTAWPEQVDDVWVEIDYEGDVAAAHIHHQILTDHIHYGHSWMLGLKQSRHLLADHELRLSITPIRRGTIKSYVNQAYVERFEGVEIGKFNEIRVRPHYRVGLIIAGREDTSSKSKSTRVN